MSKNGSQVSYQELLSILGTEFDRRMVEEPDFLDGLPPNSHVALQICIDVDMEAELKSYIQGFNAWAIDLAKHQLGSEQSLCVAQCVMRPLIKRAATGMTRQIARAACTDYELVGS